MATARNPNSTRRLKRLNNRQRKKMRVGDYRELGFHLTIGLQADADTDGLLDGWLSRVDEADVSFGGHFDGKDKLEGVVFPISQTKITDALRSELIAWLQARSEVATLEASELLDLWHAV